jgi:hypothetical protein
VSARFIRVSRDFKADCISAIVIFLGVDFLEADFFELVFEGAVFLREERFLVLDVFLSAARGTVVPDADFPGVSFSLSSPDD